VHADSYQKPVIDGLWRAARGGLPTNRLNVMGAWYHLFLRILAGWLLLKNLALRHQLAVLNRNAAKPKFHDSDRLLWVDLRAVWSR